MRAFKLGLLGILGILGSAVFAQSNVTYELRIGTTEEVQILTDFPENYEGEKVNV